MIISILVLVILTFLYSSRANAMIKELHAKIDSQEEKLDKLYEKLDYSNEEDEGYLEPK